MTPPITIKELRTVKRVVEKEPNKAWTHNLLLDGLYEYLTGPQISGQVKRMAPRVQVTRNELRSFLRTEPFKRTYSTDSIMYAPGFRHRRKTASFMWLGFWNDQEEE